MKLPKKINDYFISLREMSDDPDTQTAAVITYADGSLLSGGSNTIPLGISKMDFMFLCPAKYDWIEHAESNAIYRAAKNGKSTYERDMWIDWFPCIACARGIIQCGIKRLYCRRPNFNNPKWGRDFIFVQDMLNESVVEVVFYD